MGSSHEAPPAVLDTPLELDTDDWDRRDLYLLLTGLVIPRPIAWVSTMSPGGVPNLAPHSYFNLVASDPPHVMFSSTGVKDTLRNVRETGEFVVNLATVDLVEEMNATATDAPAGTDEFAWVGLVADESVTVAPPRVARARAHLECRVAHELALGRSNLVIGRVTHVHVDPSVWSNGRIDPELLDPVCRLSGNSYAELGDVFRVERPRWSQVRNAAPDDRIPRRSP